MPALALRLLVLLVVSIVFYGVVYSGHRLIICKAMAGYARQQILQNILILTGYEVR
jgi:hypothetical protein